jgi:4-hydroxy-tetrahydrodipicolinate synthase
VLHYEAVAAACTLPIIMYNVPSRTGCDMQPDTIRVLAQNPRIVGIKEATGDLGRLDRLRGCVPADFALLSGDDGSSCAFVLMGGDGVISVTSNCAPSLMAQLMAHASKGELDAARALQTRLLPLFDVLFAESNPIVVKAAMALQGQIEAHVRLPLCSLSPAVHERLQGVIEDGLFT